MTHSILYISSASLQLGTLEINKIMEHAEVANNARGITGFLLFNDNSFIQLLEGSEQEVKDLYGKILNDPRHQHLIVLLKDKYEQPCFKGYHSAFKVFDNAIVAHEFNEYISEISAVVENEHSRSLKIITGIIRSM
jgi:hypothetical protein